MADEFWANKLESGRSSIETRVEKTSEDVRTRQFIHPHDFLLPNRDLCALSFRSAGRSEPGAIACVVLHSICQVTREAFYAPLPILP